MKKLALILALCLGVLCCLSAGFRPEKDAGDSTFQLPRALVTIEDEAFAGTSAQNVILPESLVSIGERAFADNRALHTVVIPRSVTAMGEHVFDGSPALTIQGEEGSYAESWAREHGIRFVQPNSMQAVMQRLQRLLKAGSLLLPFLCLPSDTLLKPRRRVHRRGRTMRPQERPELYPINYKFP